MENNYADIERHQATFRSIAIEEVNKIMDSLDELSGFSVYRNDLLEKDIEETFEAILSYTHKVYDMYKCKRSTFRFTSDKSKDAIKLTSEVPVVKYATSKVVEMTPHVQPHEKYARRAIRYYENNEYVRTYPSLTKAAADTGIPMATLRRHLIKGDGVTTMYDNFKFEMV